MSIVAINAGQQIYETKLQNKVEQQKEDTNWFSEWLNDKDKVCTDGKDDGSLSFGEMAESFGKGLIGLVKGAINHPIATATMFGIGAFAMVATGGAALPVMIALGAGTGAVMIGKGAYDVATAETDAEAKSAWEGIGNGTFALAASALGAKSSLNAASKAGVTGAEGAKDLNTAQALVRNFDVLPSALKVSGQNIKGNVLTWTSSLKGENIIYQNSNKLRAFDKQTMTTHEPTHPEAPRSEIEYLEVPGGTKIKTPYGVKTVGENEFVIKNFNGEYDVRRLQFGRNFRGHLTVNGELVIKDSGKLSKIGQSVLAQKEAKVNVE